MTYDIFHPFGYRESDQFHQKASIEKAVDSYNQMLASAFGANGNEKFDPVLTLAKDIMDRQLISEETPASDCISLLKQPPRLHILNSSWAKI